MNAIVIQKIRSAPTEPGVYIFRQGKDILYIGKAANLKNRLKSYLKITDIKTQSLHEEADGLEYVVLRSNIEALIEESRLIKSLKPKYNVLWMDDKSYFYVYFTNDIFPKVYIGHEHSNRIMKHESRSRDHDSRFMLRASRGIGPFTDGGALRIVLKLLRRSFPYCTCLPAARLSGRQGRPASTSGHLRDCLNAQIGKCLGICCLAARDPAKRDKKVTTNDRRTSHSLIRANETIKQYAKNIRTIKMILSGRGQKLMASLKDDKERWALKSIFEHREFLSHDSLTPNTYSLNPIKRIECYDNSNFAGKEAVGAMTVLVKREPRIMNNESRIMENEWVADKSQWRKFKIKNTPTRDDPRMIGEILSRRLNHPEWPYPDLIVIDGGITQYRAAKKVLDKFHLKHSTLNIKLVSYAKPQRKVIGMAKALPCLPDRQAAGRQAQKELQELIERAIHQTHRFVINYHRHVRAKAFLPPPSPHTKREV